MSSMRRFLSNLSSAKATFLFCTVVGVVTSVFVAGSPGGLLNGLFAFSVWIVLGLFFGGIEWVVDTLSLWKRSLNRRSTTNNDPAFEALRERYARGEIDENQFDSMSQRLQEV